MKFGEIYYGILERVPLPFPIILEFRNNQSPFNVTVGDMDN